MKTWKLSFKMTTKEEFRGIRASVPNSENGFYQLKLIVLTYFIFPAKILVQSDLEVGQEKNCQASQQS